MRQASASLAFAGAHALLRSAGVPQCVAGGDRTTALQNGLSALFHCQRMKLSELRITSMPRGVAILFACALVVVILQALISQYVMNSVAETTRDIDVARAQLDQVDEARDLLIDAETASAVFF